MSIAPYQIQEWLFHTANGKFDIDLAESGIQYHYVQDLHVDPTIDLNYCKDQGQDFLRNDLADLYRVHSSNVLISHGSQEGLYLFYRSLLQAGDHVIVTQPGWQQSWEVPRAIGCDISFLRLRSEEDYRLDPKALSGLIKKNTKLLILNYPNNPTGKALEDDEWQEVIQIARRHDLWILNDEEYFVQYPKSLVHQYEKAVIVSGLSKVYGFPGLRIGWLISRSPIIEKATNYKRYVTVCNSTLCETLGLQVLRQRKTYIDRYDRMVAAGLKVLKEWLRSHEGFKLIEPQGTPYAYLRVPKSIDSAQLVAKVLHEQKVLMMPAEVFEDSHAIRLTFGREIDVLKEGLERVSKVLHG